MVVWVLCFEDDFFVDGQSVDFVFVRHDSAYFMQAWSALAAPSVCELAATKFVHRAVEDGIGSNLSCLAVIT